MTRLLESGLKLPLNDKLAGAVLRRDAAQEQLALVLQERPTEVFNQMWQIGQTSISGLLSVLQNGSRWNTEKARIKTERDVLTLLLAKLLEPGLDHPEIAMKAIARLLAVDASNLENLIDSDSFETILTSLKIGNPVSLRSQATLVAAKILEVNPSRGQRLLAEYVISRIAKQSKDNLIQAFSAAGAIFPVVPSMAAGLFLTEGFVTDLLKLVSSSGSSKVTHAGLDLLSAACVDRTCRATIAKNCTTYLQQAVESDDERTSSTAGLVLAKTQEINTAVDSDALFSLFRSLALKSDDEVNQISIEGLAFTSIQPTVKEALGKDETFLRDLADTLLVKRPGPLGFGILTVFNNMTEYSQRNTPEEKRMAQLKAYANKSKPEEPSPLDSEEKVSARCSKAMDASLVPALISFAKNHLSPVLLSLITGIISSLAKHPRHRGKMVQQGLLDVLLNLSNIDPSTKDAVVFAAQRRASLALAQVLIPIDPSLLFTTSRPVIRAVRPLQRLLKPSEAQQSGPSPVFGGGGSTERDLFAAREALKALTNLATTGGRGNWRHCAPLLG